MAVSLDLSIKRGSLTAIIGPVGSGKSTVLAALVGELKPEGDPEICFSGPVGYASQQAWLQNASIRENILFGSPWDEQRYAQVLDAAALHPDLAILPHGDETEVGERGVSLSGGQKQRISMARLMYSQAEVILMDDPLSAVDAQVGRHLFNKCIKGMMADKTRLLVTHQLHLLNQVDWIIVMERADGMGVSGEKAVCRIGAQGTYQDLLQSSDAFEALMAQFGGKEVRTEDAVDKASDSSVPSKNSNNKPAATTEDRAIGSVSWSVYREYIKFAGGWRFIGAALFGMLLVNGVRLATDFWLSWWTQNSTKGTVSGFQYALFGTAAHSTGWYASIYAGLGVSQGLVAFAQALVFAWCCTEAARRLHQQALRSLLRAPIASFFDLHSTGRIINRFSKDLDVVDNLLTESLRSCLSMLGSTVTSLLVIVISSWWFIIPLVPLLALYQWAQTFYRRSSRELKRLDALSRSPMVSLLTDTLVGMSTLRAYHRQDHFQQRMTGLLNENGRPSLLQLMAQRWLAIRLESVGNLIILAASLACFIAPVPSSLVGLAVGYSLSITGMMHWLVRQLTDSETQVISSERLTHYAHNLPQEGSSLAIEPPAEWPSQGAIEVKEISLRYRPELPLVLRQLCLTVKAGQRVGIVGRTGAGKSSLLVALFRMVELSEGSIEIDGVPIESVPLDRLRRSLSIIPQDPVIFSGTIRSNLDPFNEHTDLELWDALKAAHLASHVTGMTDGLESTVGAGGDNLSVGQRQLLCLARAILRRSKIVVLDEATASIDPATDQLIQEGIRQEFKHATILTIAHRLTTVLDYDWIVVVEGGRVAEQGPPDLLRTQNGLFANLLKESH